MNENFEALLEESLGKINMTPGSLTTATILEIGRDFVTVCAGLKSEALIPIKEFRNPEGALTVSVGDMVELVLESVENGYGETSLSREKAKRMEVWRVLERVHDAEETIEGLIIERVKGGFSVDLDSIKAFLPGSLVDVRPVRNPESLEGERCLFKIVNLDKERGNLVVSRRAVIEKEYSAEREQLLSSLAEGQTVSGVVKNLTDYGAFVDLGGVDGLLHLTDMSWKRLKHPSECVNIGDTLTVSILKFDKEKLRVSLGLKQLSEDPWGDVIAKYPAGTRLKGKVTNLTDYGCFVELEPGVEGLVHMSEMDWTNKNVHPSKIVQMGQEVEVQVIEIDEKRRRISLGMKQCADNPWEQFAKDHQRWDTIAGTVKSVTDFGVFVGLPGNIDGLVHLSDVSWQDGSEAAIRDFKKGDEVTALVLAIDPARERISLGLKQLEVDPKLDFSEKFAVGETMKAEIMRKESDHYLVDVTSGVKGSLAIADCLTAEEALEVGQHIMVEVTAADQAAGTAQLKQIEGGSRRRAQQHTLNEQEAPVDTSLGDLIKEHIANAKND